MNFRLVSGGCFFVYRRKLSIFCVSFLHRAHPGSVERLFRSVGESADRVLFPRLAALQPSRKRLGFRYAPSLASSGLSPSVGATRLHTLGAPFRLHAAARLGPLRFRRDCAAAFRLHSAPRVLRRGDGLLSSSVSLRTTQGEETGECLRFF